MTPSQVQKIAKRIIRLESRLKKIWKARFLSGMDTPWIRSLGSGGDLAKSNRWNGREQLVGNLAEILKHLHVEVEAFDQHAKKAALTFDILKKLEEELRQLKSCPDCEGRCGDKSRQGAFMVWDDCQTCCGQGVVDRQ